MKMLWIMIASGGITATKQKWQCAEAATKRHVVKEFSFNWWKLLHSINNVNVYANG
jgi:hypothetical protein